MTEKPKSPPDDAKTGGRIALPPIDAEPEEIAQALFQRPPLKKPGSRESGHGDNSPTKA